MMKKENEMIRNRKNTKLQILFSGFFLPMMFQVSQRMVLEKHTPRKNNFSLCLLDLLLGSLCFLAAFASCSLWLHVTYVSL